MKPQSYGKKIKAVRSQVQRPTQRVAATPDQEHTLLANALEESSTGDEKLEVVHEELRQQKQEWAESRLDVKISETRYRRLFETAQDGILILDFDTEQISDVNPFLVEMLGYPREEVLGKKIWEMGAFKDVEASKAAFLELRKKGYVRYEDLPLQTKDGRLIAVEFVSNVYAVDHKKVIQCNIRDITERKRAEDALKEVHDELTRRVEERTAELVKANEILAQQVEERKQAEKALRKSEERYRTLVETMNEGLGVVDEKGVWTYVNEKFCKVVGYTYDEIIGRPAHEWLDEANRKILNGQLIKRTRGEQEPYVIAGIKKDGSTVHAHVSPKPLFDETGQFRGSFAVFTDITKQKKTEESLRNALSEIRSLRDKLESENIYFRQEIKTRYHFDHIIGQSHAFKYVLYRAEQVAPTNTTVLILGETGTGKELIAAAIHQMSPRKDRPLIIVNCAALPPNLIESELFGREKGAFTGADTRQVGRFDVANGSTLCLDEIGELPLEVQAKLLRVIQHNEFERLGSSHTIRVDVRIVATTNRNLEEAVRKGQFRQDLYYRINVFPLTIPPLRQRKDDIPLMVQAFIERYARKLGKKFTSVQEELIKVWQDYDWPGNVRELENVIERAVILCPGPVLKLVDKLENPIASLPSQLKTMEEAERDHILKTLSETRWRINGKKGAAAILGIHPSTLRARMHKLGIRRPEIKTPD